MEIFGNDLDILAASELRLVRKVLYKDLCRETDPEKKDFIRRGIEELNQAIENRIENENEQLH